MTVLSILLPTYNGSRFLAEQLNSILAQSQTDWELLVCDDGSQDDTVSILETFARADRRVRMMSTDGNMGQRQRLRQLFDLSTSDLIAVADQDDIWHPDKIGLLLAGLGGADLAFGSSWLIDSEGRQLGRTLTDSLPPTPVSGDRLSYLFRPAVSAHAMVVRRDLFGGPGLESVLPFDWLLSLEAAFRRGVNFVPAAKTMHRMHGANQMNGALAVDGSRGRIFDVRDMRARWDKFATRRWHVSAFLAYLSRSTLIDEGTASILASAVAICRRGWTGEGTLVTTGLNAFRSDIAAALLPLAGSERDAEYFRAQISSLTRGPLHPARLLNQITRSIRARGS